MRKSHFSGKELWRVLGKNERNIKSLRQKLDAKIDVKRQRDNDNADILIMGKNAMQEYVLSEILEALASGFDLKVAILLEDEEFVFKKVNLRTYARGSRLSFVRARIVGSEGKSKRVIQSLTDCFISLSDNYVAIIGKPESIELASKAIESLIRGTKHANVFKFLEKSQGTLEEQAELLEEFEEEKRNR
jgi:ribosomal RNA assembly protein